jgi:tryptophan synthase beta chain
MVRDFQSIIGREALRQCRARGLGIPHAIIACVGGGSNAMGIFHPFRRTPAGLIGVEAGGTGSHPGEHAASLTAGEVGIFHGEKSYFLQSDEGQISPVHSIAAGLDYPGVGPEHAFLKESGRARYVSVSDQQAVSAFKKFARTEGIIPALESAHAIAHAIELAPTLSPEKILLVNLSGRGDKDLSEGCADG